MSDMCSPECPQVAIRVAGTPDVPSIRDIARRTWADTYRGVIAADAQDAILNRAYSDEALAASIGCDQAFLVAEAGNSIAGFVDIDFDSRRINLHRLYVLPEYQRLGLGRRLLEAALDRTRSCLAKGAAVSLVAHVERDNPKARAFYKKIGFTEGEEEIVVIGGVSLPVVPITMTIKGD